MAKTVTIGNKGVTHLLVSGKDSPLCGAAYLVAKGERKTGTGEVTCDRCKRVLQVAAKNALA